MDIIIIINIIIIMHIWCKVVPHNCKYIRNIVIILVILLILLIIIIVLLLILIIVNNK